MFMGYDLSGGVTGSGQAKSPPESKQHILIHPIIQGHHPTHAEVILEPTYGGTSLYSAVVVLSNRRDTALRGSNAILRPIPNPTLVHESFQTKKKRYSYPVYTSRAANGFAPEGRKRKRGRKDGKSPVLLCYPPTADMYSQ